MKSRKRGYKVLVQYHVGGGSKTYSLHTSTAGVFLVGRNDKYKPTIYRTTEGAVKGIRRLFNTGRNIIAVRIEDVK